jgi:hypothetical protein
LRGEEERDKTELEENEMRRTRKWRSRRQKREDERG